MPSDARPKACPFCCDGSRCTALTLFLVESSTLGSHRPPRALRDQNLLPLFAHTLCSQVPPCRSLLSQGEDSHTAVWTRLWYLVELGRTPGLLSCAALF